ncbi:sigma 54-interacting transcriptional regulator [Shigella flexneri]
MLESELFGHARSASLALSAIAKVYSRRRKSSTLFLDQIGDMPAPLQVNCCACCRSVRVPPLGSNRDIDIDVRIIPPLTATCQKRWRAGIP